MNLLCHSPKKQTAVYWPTVVDQYLDDLLAAAVAAGEDTSRAQILAALVVHSSTDGEGLGVMVREYRRMGVDTLEKRNTGHAPPVGHQRPGPRTHK